MRHAVVTRTHPPNMFIKVIEKSNLKLYSILLMFWSKLFGACRTLCSVTVHGNMVYIFTCLARMWCMCSYESGKRSVIIMKLLTWRWRQCIQWNSGTPLVVVLDVVTVQTTEWIHSRTCSTSNSATAAYPPSIMELGHWIFHWSVHSYWIAKCIILQAHPRRNCGRSVRQFQRPVHWKRWRDWTDYCSLARYQAEAAGRATRVSTVSCWHILYENWRQSFTRC